jgi:hypothetical protein
MEIRIRRYVMSTLKTLAAAFLILALAAPSAAKSVALPDYHKEAKKVHRRECDSDTTHVTMYRTPTYYVTEAITDSGNSFIMMYSTSGEANFLAQPAGSGGGGAEVSREKWYEGILAAAPNYFRHIRGMANSDCYVAEHYFDQD